jgi:hypothetical protein
MVFNQSVWQGNSGPGGVIVWDWVNGEMILVRLIVGDSRRGLSRSSLR